MQRKAHCYLVRLRSYMQGCSGNHCQPLAVALVVGAVADVLADVVDGELGVEAAVTADEAVAAFAAAATGEAELAPGDCYAPESVLEEHRSRSCDYNYDHSRKQAFAFVTAAGNAAVSVQAQAE